MPPRSSCHASIRHGPCGTNNKNNHALYVSGGDPYLTEGETLLTTTDDELPVKALSNCKKLRKVVLPTTLTAIGQEALSGCSGLVNDETVPVWVEEPVFSCEADIDSPAGEYPITVTAKAESYNLTFVAGTLTVTDATGITTVKNDPKDNTAVYDLSGRRVENTIGHKGIYIRNGKKYIK